MFYNQENSFASIPVNEGAAVAMSTQIGYTSYGWLSPSGAQYLLSLSLTLLGPRRLKSFFLKEREREWQQHIWVQWVNALRHRSLRRRRYTVHTPSQQQQHTHTKKEYFFFSFPLWSSNFLATQETVCLEFSQLLRSRDSWTRVPSSRLFYYTFDSHTFDVFVFTIVLTSNCFRLRAVTNGATRLVFFFFFYYNVD